LDVCLFIAAWAIFQLFGGWIKNIDLKYDLQYFLEAVGNTFELLQFEEVKDFHDHE
jgi:hypothetical protein